VEEPKPRVYVGVKWGMDNPTVMLAAEYTPAPKDHLHIFRELYEESFYFDDLLPIAKAWAQELNIRKFYCDPKEPEFIKLMRRQRLWAVAAPEELGLARNLLGKRVVIQGKSLKELIDRLGRNPNEVERMDVPGGISISRECPKTIPEFMKYRMPERDPRRPFRDKPLDMDNYGIGALHFLILGLATEVTPRVRWL
jgi:hypothetical protein